MCVCVPSTAVDPAGESRPIATFSLVASAWKSTSTIAARSRAWRDEILGDANGLTAGSRNSLPSRLITATGVPSAAAATHQPLPGAVRRVVGRAHDPRVHAQVLVHLPLAEGVVSERDHVDPGAVQAAGEPARDAGAVGQVLAVCDHEADVALGPQARHLLLDDPPPGSRERVGDEEDPHAAGLSRGTRCRRGRGPDLDVHVVAGVRGVLGHLLRQHLGHVDDRPELASSRRSRSSRPRSRGRRSGSSA